MKKTIAVFLSLALIFLNSSSSLAISKDNKKMTPKEKSVEVLIESGWTASEIADLDETELLTFENLKPAGGSETYYKIESNFKVKTVYDEKSQKNVKKLVGNGSKMIPVTKELCMKKVESVKNYVSNIDELEKKINALNIDSTSNKNDTINITPLATYDNGTDTVRTETWIELKLDAYYQGGTRYKFTQNATWLTNPLYRETDVFAIGHSTTFANEADTEYCKYTWDVRYTADGTYRFGETQSKSWYRAPKRDAGGIGFTIPLASTYNSEYAASQGNGILTWENTNHRIFMSYWGNVNPNGLVDAYVIVFGHYAHQQREFTGVTPSFSIPLGGSLSLDSESTYDVADNTAIRLRVNY